jgi:hypothetical protein
MTFARTEDDLRIACAALAEQAPSPDEVLARLKGRQGQPDRVFVAQPPANRRAGRWTAPVGIAAALIAVFVATSLAVRGGSSGTAASPTVSPIAMSGGPAFNFPYTMRPVAGYYFGVETVTDTAKVTSVIDAQELHPPYRGFDANSLDNTEQGTVYALAAGQFDGNQASRGEKISLANGLTAHLGQMANLSQTPFLWTQNGSSGFVTPFTAKDKGLHPTIAWQTPGGVWYAVQWRAAVSETVMLSIANAVDTSAPHAARTPLTVSSLPAGIDTRGQMSSSIGPDPHSAFDQFSVSFASSADPASQITISWNTSDISTQLQSDSPSANSTPLRIGSHDAEARTDAAGGLSIVVSLGQEGLIDISGQGAADTLSTLISVAQGIDLVKDPTDVENWHDATQALPH